MNWHEAWIWMWFLLGMTTYWAKRAYYGIAPPNPVAHSYAQYVQRAWIPLLVRGFIESMIFWIMFTPGLADKALAYFGWTSYGWAVQAMTSVAPAGALMGHAFDSIMDMAVSKIPLIRDILPQMPGALPQEAVVQSQLVETATATKVTTLQQMTTVVPEAK